MQLYQKTDDTTDILSYDIFTLLDLKDMNQKRREDYLQKFQLLALRYFFQEKIGEALTDQEKEEYMNKYPPDDDKSVQALLEALGNKFPDASDKLMDAMIEIKAQLIKDQYVSKKKLLEERISKADDDRRKQLLTEKLQDCEKRLALVEQEEWHKLADMNSVK